MRKYRILRLARRLLPIVSSALAAFYWAIKLASEAANYRCSPTTITVIHSPFRMGRWFTYQRKGPGALALI
jgi:hypothetical protein